MTKNKLVQLIYFIGFVIGGLLLSQLLFILMIAAQQGADFSWENGLESLVWQLTPQQLLVQQMISQIFGLIVPAFLYYKLFQTKNGDSTKQPMDIKNLIEYVAFFILFLPLVACSAYYNQLIPFPDWVLDSEQRVADLLKKMLNLNGPADFLLALIVVAVIPAISEEWIFRGILQKHLHRMFEKPWLALVLASILFSTVHMQFLGFFPRLLLGLVLGFVFLMSNNLWYPIALHFINNGFQVVTLFFIPKEQLEVHLSETDLPNVYLTCASTLLALWLGMYLFKKNQFATHA